jgi:uncharacterized repeat protein (TIGR03803 family)
MKFLTHLLILFMAATAPTLEAQTFTTLHNFIGGSRSAGPAGLILAGNTLYGTTSQGGASGNGAVFAVNTDGTGFTNIYSFTGGNNDGLRPASLILTGNTLYGTSQGTSNSGAIFTLNTDGTGFTNIYNFTGGNDGANLQAGLVLVGDTLYGSAELGGAAGNGTVFSVNTDGTGFTNIYNFTALDDQTNGDGINPSPVILAGNTLFGTTSRGGVWGAGTVFALNTNGANFTVLYNFMNGIDGGTPENNLALAGNTLFGAAHSGGNAGNGTLFALNTDGTGFTVLHAFTALNNSPINSDGSVPSGLILAGNALFGTTDLGGASGHGTVFAVNTNGTGFNVLHHFTPVGAGNTNGDGIFPISGVISSGNTLYGTATRGGSLSVGTLFALTVPVPALQILPSGNQSILFWPVSGINYVLKTTTNLASANWVTASNAVPVTSVTVSNQLPAAFFQLQLQ